MMGNFKLSNSYDSFPNVEDTQSRAGNQSLACRTATVDNTKLPKTIPFSELPDSTGDSNDKLLDTHVREDNNTDAAISKYNQHGFLDLPSLLNGIDFNFEINGNNEMEWPFDNSPVFNDSNIFSDTENHKSSQSVASRTATVDNTKLPKTIPFSELPDSTGDSNDKLLDTHVREDNNTDAAISKYNQHGSLDLPSLLNGIDFNFEINGNNEMEWPFDNSPVFNDSNIFSDTENHKSSQSVASRTATVDNTKLPKTIPFSELPDSTGDSNDKLLDTHVREDNNTDAAISKYNQHGSLDLPSLLNGIDFNFEINGNNEMEWPFDNSPVFNDSNIFSDTENHKSSQSVASRTATVDNTKLPKTIPFSELPDSTGDSNDKLLNTPVREDNNTDAAISEYYPHTSQDLPSLSNGIDFNFEINGNNKMEWPFDNSSLFNDCNIFSDTESAKWSPFFPPCDFNPETYLNSEQEFLPTMNDQYAPQNKKHTDEVNSDSNTQKQFQTKRDFQQSINGRCVDSSPDPQMQSGTFEEIAGFYTNNLMQPFLVSTFGMQPFEHSSALSSVVQNTTEGTFQNETYADEAYKDRDDQKQLTKNGISKIQEANEQNIESAPDRQIHNNKSEEVADCSTDNGTQTTQSTSESRMGVLPEKNGEKTPHVCFQCGQAFQNVSILCKHINQCLKSNEEKRHESIMDDVRDQVNESAMAASCSQAVHEPPVSGKAQDKFPWKTCNLCGKQFASNSSLAIHYRSHTKETPYMCDICGRRFTTNFSKNRHRKRCTLRLTSLFCNHNSTVNLEDDIVH